MRLTPGRRRCLALVVVPALAFAAVAAADQSLDMPREDRRPWDLDSGHRAHDDAGEAIVYRTLLRIEDAAWIRLFFGAATALPAGSRLRITALHDLERQELDADALAAWHRSSAYFNGSHLLVELVAGPGARPRVVIDAVAVEAGFANPLGACGVCDDDDRVPSQEAWTGRLLPAGCSATVSTTDSCLVSAGHCVDGTDGDVIQFRVPPSNPDCSLNHPPVAEQFPIAEKRLSNGGVGDDWSVMTTGTNTLGETAYERYGVMRPVSNSGPRVGDAVTIWGYGVDAECDRSQTQQTSGGTVEVIAADYFRHGIDATFGNSGSAIIRDGRIVGIATHCPCPNAATRIDQTAFRAARDELCGEQFAQDECAGALPVGDGEVAFDTDGATTDGPELPETCDEGRGLLFRNDIWFAYDATCDGVATAGVCDATFDTRLAVYEDGTCPGAFLACNDDACGEGGTRSSLTFPVTAGARYLVRVGARFAVGRGTLSIACDDSAACPADLDGSGGVDFGDVLVILTAWGPCVGCPEDLDDSGAVDFGDILAVLADWGPCEAGRGPRPGAARAVPL